MAMDEMSFELDSKLLEQVWTLLAPYGMEPEDLMAGFARWCVDDPRRAKKALLQWQAEMEEERSYRICGPRSFPDQDPP